jgi:chaperonin GroES
MKYRPLGDRLVIKPFVEKEETTAGGIVIPSVAQERPNEGEVLAVGPGKIDDSGKTLPMHVKVGDVVVFGKFSGLEVSIEKQKLLLLRESEVYAVAETEAV